MLYGMEGVITSDSIILDHCSSWINLTSECLRRKNKQAMCVWWHALIRFRHRSPFFLYSRPCGAALIERFLSGRTHFSYFSVQKHWKQEFSSMRNSIFPEILFLEGRECVQSKLLYRILRRPGRNSNKTSYFAPVLWTFFLLRCLSVPKAFLGTGWQLVIWVS